VNSNLPKAFYSSIT